MNINSVILTIIIFDICSAGPKIHNKNINVDDYLQHIFNVQRSLKLHSQQFFLNVNMTDVRTNLQPGRRVSIVPSSLSQY